jgi:aryl-alcohol dehydrogenase-like predicted oxidoreductase
MTIEYRALGKTGLRVSTLGFGGSEIGYQGVAQKTVDKILNTALDAGINVVDSAECYANGEQLVGKALARRRAEVVLMTKCGHALGFIGSDWEPKMLAKSIDRSLKRLQTDHVDVMAFHSCDAATLRNAKVVEVLTRARDAGKARFIGYSGDSDAALDAVEMGIFDTLQISLNIADQEAIDRVVPKAIARGMGVIVKRPIANSAWRTGKAPVDPYARPYWDRLQKLGYDFLRSEVEASIATALRFTLGSTGVATAIVGTTKPERIAQNIGYAAAGPLAPAEYVAIRSRWHSVSRADWVGLR